MRWRIGFGTGSQLQRQRAARNRERRHLCDADARAFRLLHHLQCLERVVAKEQSVRIANQNIIGIAHAERCFMRFTGLEKDAAIAERAAIIPA